MHCVSALTACTALPQPFSPHFATVLESQVPLAMVQEVIAARQRVYNIDSGGTLQSIYLLPSTQNMCSREILGRWGDILNKLHRSLGARRCLFQVWSPRRVSPYFLMLQKKPSYQRWSFSLTVLHAYVFCLVKRSLVLLFNIFKSLV